MNRFKAFRQLVLTRFREFYREPEVIFWVYGFPLILAIVLFVAFSGRGPDPPKVDIQGDPQDERMIALKEKLEAAWKRAALEDAPQPKEAEAKPLPVEIHPPEECLRRLKKGATELVVIPKEDGTTEFFYDKAQPESVLARRWIAEIRLRDQFPSVKTSYRDRDKLITEPGSRYIDFLLPGLIGMNIMGGGLFGVGFVLVDMRVRKLFKRLLATPMRRLDFILALFVARMVFLVPEMLSLLVVGYFFGVPIYGNVFLLILVMILGAVVFSSMGLLVGCRTEKVETASGLINVIMLPMYLLSGVFFKSDRFPDVIQPFIQVLPLTQVNDALREVMLEGSSLGDIAWRLGILLAWTGVCLPLALKWFRWR